MSERLFVRATPTLVRWLAGCLACFIVMATAGAARDYQLPTIGQPADAYMSPAKEDKLGRQVVSELLGRGMIIEDALLSEYVNQVGNRLVRHTSGNAGNFRFYVIDSAQVNAFALPGGYVGINAGLLTETDNESELAGVMSHEIAHVTQRHIARQIEATSGMGWATAAAVLLAAVAGGGDPDAISAAVAAGVSNLGQQQTNYTRSHEYEADRLGIRTLAAADYDPDAMSSFFAKMQRRARLYGTQLPQILLSHPVSTTRMAEAESRAADYGAIDVRESPQYALMKERARVLAGRQLSDLARYYENRRADGRPAPALDYGYALVLNRLGRNQEAADLLRPLARAHPDMLAYRLALAHTYSRAGQLATARRQLDAIRADFPDSAAAKLDYARTLIEAGEPGAARDYLLGEPQLLASASEAQEMLARAAGQQGRLGEAYYRQARFHEMRGAYAPAINQLRAALQTADLNAFNESRLRAQLDQIVRACHDAWSERECRERVNEDARPASTRPGSAR